MVEKDLTKSGTTAVTQPPVQTKAPRGFEDEQEGDVIIPRIKCIQDLSPERKEKIADSGDLINSLTKQSLNDKNFIPIYRFNTNIWWKPRNEGGGIQCRSFDGKVGNPSDGGHTLQCQICAKNEFDNTKSGVEAQPQCTKYINFLGFIEGEQFPIVLSFAKTNYNEGKRMYSLAKFTMKDMWKTKYALTSKEVSKANNDWFIIEVKPSGIPSDNDIAFAEQMFEMFRASDVKMHVDDDEYEQQSFIDETDEF